MSDITLGLKIDIDTERGTRLGVPNLLKLFHELDIKATFLFSLGPDHTGRAIKRLFRPGFFQKVARTSVLQIYGLRTLLNGIVLPGPHIGKKHKNLMRGVFQSGHEVGIHCYDHIKWQDNLHKMTLDQVRCELQKARDVFSDVFGFDAKTAGAAGWQANASSLQAYDEAGFDYGSDTRGRCAFYPQVGSQTFKTLQIPTTLPTLDELLGRKEYPIEAICDHYLKLIKPNQLNVLTLHTELEGMKYFEWFKVFLKKAKEKRITMTPLETLAKTYKNVTACPLVQGEIEGRSGFLALQEKNT